VRERDLAHALALAAAAGPWEPAAMAGRFALALERPTAPWMRALAKRLTSSCTEAPQDLEALATKVRQESAFHRAVVADRSARAVRHLDPSREGELLDVRRWLVPEPFFHPSGLAVPSLATAGELAEWLGVDPGVLDWLADVRGMNRRVREPRLDPYHRRWIAKRSGGSRLIEAPKTRLKRAQRIVLRDFLGPLVFHPAASGFVPGRSVHDHVRPHVGRAVVVRMDLRDFFWSIPPGRVRALFATLGYPPEVARLLTGLVTTRTPSAAFDELARASTPAEIARRFALRQRLTYPHLPQGAPTSGAIATACARGLDRRLTGLAARFGATYSRYADDLAFSGDRAFARELDRFIPRVGAIAIDEGFEVRFEKTRVMRASVRQALCGVVLNEKPSLPRRELETLEAILFNCVRYGPQSQNRASVPDFRAHLAGRIAWVREVAPHRAEKLTALFDRVAWDR
jgi:hypothetical protein